MGFEGKICQHFHADATFVVCYLAAHLTFVYGCPGGNLWLPIWTLSNDIIGGRPERSLKCNKETLGLQLIYDSLCGRPFCSQLGVRSGSCQLPVASYQLPVASCHKLGHMLPQIIATFAGSRIQVKSR